MINNDQTADARSRRLFLRQSALAAGGLIFGGALAACGDEEPTTSSATPRGDNGTDTTVANGTNTTVANGADPSQLSGTISLWAWGAGPEFEAWQNRIKYFNSRFPNVEVQFEPLARNGYEEYPQLLTRIAGGNAPDVMRVLNFQPLQLVNEGGALLPLDDLIANTPDFNDADFFETPWIGGKVDGVQYAIPQNGEPYVVYYNADAFERAGLEDPQTRFAAGTWDENAFLEAVDALIDRGGTRFGVAFESWNYDNFAFMGGGQILDDDLAPVIDKGASPAMLQLFADLVRDGKAPNPVVAGGAHFEPFRNGEVGMYIMGPWWGPALEATPPEFAWNTTGLPSFNSVRGCKLEIDSLCISSATPNPEAAWAFVQMVTDTEGLRIWSEVGTPTRRSALEVAGYADISWRRDSLPMLEVSTYTPFTTDGFAVDTAATAALDPLWAGQATAEEATASAAKAIGDVLAG